MLRQFKSREYLVARTLLFLISFFFALSGYWEVTRHPITYLKTIQMGYPPYFIVALGVAKICGAVVLLLPRFYHIKEWVFAGFTFDVVFAFVSGLATGYYVDAVKAVFAFVVILTCYCLFRKQHEAIRLELAANAGKSLT